MPSPLFFLSYTRSDGGFALKLGKDLKAHGINVWIDQLDIKAGAHWDNEVQQTLKKADGIIVILTPESVQSDNVLDEISLALDKKKRIIPVLAEDCEAPLRIIRLQRVDFTKGYDRGLAALKAAVVTASSAPPPVSTGDRVQTGKESSPPSSSFFGKNKILLFSILALVVISVTVLITKNMLGSGTDKPVKDTTQQSVTSPQGIDTTIKAGDTTATDTAEKTKVIPLPPVNQGKVYFDNGKTYFTAKNYDAAISNFTQAINKKYNEAEACLYRGRCYSSQKNLAAACADYKEAAAKGNEDAKKLYSTTCDTLRTATEIMKSISVYAMKDFVKSGEKASFTYYIISKGNVYMKSISSVDYELPSAVSIVGATLALPKRSSSDRASGFKVSFVQPAHSKSLYLTIKSKDGTIVSRQKVSPALKSSLIAPGINLGH